MTLPVALSADLIEAFAGSFLSPRYDSPRPTPPFHREAWALYASPEPQVEVIAPRDHAKSTALTFDYILAETLFRTSDYVILIGSTEEKSSEQLSNISEELHDNKDLVEEFGIKSFDVDTRTEIIVRMQDDHRFRVFARGAEQRIRGAMWKGKRPNLIVADDMEDDEQVENKDRRAKFRRWFFRAAKQALSKTGKIRVHGTILHEDSLLNRLTKCPKCKRMTALDGRGPCPICGTVKTWKHLFYKAHAAFDDFSQILWPERWSEAQLRFRRQEFIEDGDSGGYSQEYLNDPEDDANSFLRKDDFIPMAGDDFNSWKRVCAAWDFAVSKADLANRTSCTVGGKDLANLLHFLDFRVGRWSPMESEAGKRRGEFGWIDLMFEIEDRWHPEVHFVEDGVIWRSVKQILYQEMQVRDTYLSIEEIPSIKDKATRGTSLKKRHRAGATRWNTQAEGYEDAKAEILRFTGNAAARLDDQFDSAALLSLGFDRVPLTAEGDDDSDEELEMERQDPRREEGRSVVTGY